MTLKRGVAVAASAASGVMLAALFPKFDAWFLAGLALVPLILAARAVRPRTAAGCGYLAGTVFFAILIEWFRLFDTTGWVLATGILSCYIAIFAGLVRVLSPSPAGWRGVLVPAAAWTALEWLRAAGPSGFTWGTLAYAMHGRLPLVQMVSVTGPYGLTFLIVLANAAVAALAAALWQRKGEGSGVERWAAPAGRLLLVAILAGGCWLWGARRLSQPLPQGRTVRVALLQGNVGGEGERGAWTIEKVHEAARIYLKLTEQAAAARPDVIIWPETAVPGYLLVDPEMRDIYEAVSAAAHRLHVNLVVGSSHVMPDGRRLNSSFHFDRNGLVAGRYDKVHLVPYGEFTPWRQQLGFIYRYFPIIGTEFYPGAGFTPLNMDALRLGVAICFESAFPDIARELRLNGAQVLCVTSNDAWFGYRSATWQHYDMAQFRAVENGAYLLRDTTSGFSAILDPYGREMQRSSLFIRQVLLGEVQPEASVTPYVRYGDVIVWLSILALGVFGCGGLLGRRRDRHRSSPSVV